LAVARESRQLVTRETGRNRRPNFLDAIHRLRYQVYCLERQFLDLTAHPEGRERDEFDAHAIHFAATDGDGEVVATARLVLESPLGFPLERRAVALAPEYKNLPRARTGEISRLIVAPGHRATEAQLLFGLLKELFEESRRLHLHGLLATMEHGLWRLLRRLRFPFQPIGEAMDYFGPVTPYWAAVDDLEGGYLKLLDHFQRMADRGFTYRYSNVRTPYAEDGVLEEEWSDLGASDIEGSLISSDLDSLD